MNLNVNILPRSVIIPELRGQKKDDNFCNVLKCRHFDRFTHQTLFAQTATFSASALGGRDLAPLIA